MGGIGAARGGWSWSVVWLGLALATAGCPPRDEPGADAGPTPADAAGPTPTDAGPAPDGGPSAQTTAATAALVRGLGVASDLGGPLVSDAEALRDAAPAADRRETTARERIENGVSGNSIVTDPACTTFDWSGLAVTVTFTGCVLEATGETLDGSLGLRVSFAPTAIALTFDGLAVGGSSIDGALELLLGGRCTAGDATCTPCRDTDPTCAARTATQRTLQGDVTVVAGAAAPVTVALVLTVDHDAAGTTASGTGSVTSSSFDGTFAATSLLWAMGDCLPSSGSLVFDDGSASLTNPATVGFLAATPRDGVVSLRLGAFPAAQVMLLEPCPSMP